ncbi:MAG: hypothetical protein GY757_45100 [bacterium]|nr:hypothetical protein [bacterium]
MGSIKRCLMNPLKTFLRSARDIVFLFTACLVLFTAVDNVSCFQQEKKNKCLSLSDGFGSLKLLAYKGKVKGVTVKSKGPRKKKAKGPIIKTFKWTDAAKADRETVFTIPREYLKSELRKFGRSPLMTHPGLMKRKGFKIVGRRNFMKGSKVKERVYTVVDYQQVFRRNLLYFPPLTDTLMKSADIYAGDSRLLNHFLAFVQDIPYKRPPQIYKGKFIGAFYVPLLCLERQHGDCDSKSLLLADFLATVPGTVPDMGFVIVRGQGLAHAMLGVKGTPLLGMTSIYLRQKGYYIVLETTRPGWAPGFIDRRVIDALKAGFFHFVELN